eukprot:tig00000123_g6908.t1
MRKPWSGGYSDEAICYNISSAADGAGVVDVDANRTMQWRYPMFNDPTRGVIEVDRGNDTMACFTGPECTGKKVFATEFVGDNFWKACNNAKYPSMAILQSSGTGDYSNAKCLTVNSSGIVDINKTCVMSILFLMARR